MILPIFCNCMMLGGIFTHNCANFHCNLNLYSLRLFKHCVWRGTNSDSSKKKNLYPTKIFVRYLRGIFTRKCANFTNIIILFFFLRDGIILTWKWVSPNSTILKIFEKENVDKRDKIWKFWIMPSIHSSESKFLTF